MRKFIKQNINALETTFKNYQSRFNKATKTKIRNVIDLYRNRKIAQFTTADNLIRNFINAKTDKQKQKANDQYDKQSVSKTRRKETFRRTNARNQRRKQKNRKNEPKKNTNVFINSYVLQVQIR